MEPQITNCICKNPGLVPQTFSPISTILLLYHAKVNMYIDIRTTQREDTRDQRCVVCLYRNVKL